MKLCTIAGCKNKHEAKGYCKKHYKSYMKWGDPLTVDRNKEKRIAQANQSLNKTRKNTSTKGCCIVEGCQRPILAKKMCEMHYARHRRYGTVKLQKHKRYIGDECIVFDCNKKRKTQGYCEAHYSVYKEHGTPYRPEVIKLCGVEDCGNIHLAKGLCRHHYNEWHKLLEAIEIVDNDINN